MQAAKVKSNQFLFLNVPSVSWFAWHPISIAAVTPGADHLSQDVVLHMKAYGSWSRVILIPNPWSHCPRTYRVRNQHVCVGREDVSVGRYPAQQTDRG